MLIFFLLSGSANVNAQGSTAPIWLNNRITFQKSTDGSSVSLPGIEFIGRDGEKVSLKSNTYPVKMIWINNPFVGLSYPLKRQLFETNAELNVEYEFSKYIEIDLIFGFTSPYDQVDNETRASLNALLRSKSFHLVLHNCSFFAPNMQGIHRRSPEMSYGYRKESPLTVLSRTYSPRTPTFKCLLNNSDLAILLKSLKEF